MSGIKFDVRSAGVAVVSVIGAWLLVHATEFGNDPTSQFWYGVIGIALFIGSVVFLMQGYEKVGVAGADMIEEPRVAEFLFSSVKSAPMWLGIRLYLGYEWWNAGHHKWTGPAGWLKSGDVTQADGTVKAVLAGDSLKGYWMRAVGNPDADPPVAGLAKWDVYHSLLKHMLDNEWYKWFNWVVVIGEMAIGVGLILGALTAIAGFFGVALNMSFLLAGTTSSNPILLIVTMFLILAWRVAGWIGVDYILLPRLGVPWNPGPKAMHHPGGGSEHSS